MEWWLWRAADAIQRESGVAAGSEKTKKINALNIG